MVSLFTNVPLDFTIDLALQNIYGYNKSGTCIKEKDTKDLFTLCNKNVLFIFDNTIYIQEVGLPMESSLRPVLVETKLKQTVISKLSAVMSA